MADAGSSSASAARSRGPSSSSTTTTSSPAGCRGGRGCAPALGRLVRKLRRQSRLLCAARHGAASSSARCCHQYDPLSYSRNFDFGAALDDGNEACSFASRFVLAGASAAARRPQ
ncbi:uncharacterized protein LOC8083174 [Sorghum bicolor]|jgi:hypothetical protein|uniref:Uncharacterized protein n=1 Tax=Sorghum bicolor TaxID=4558 RepID=C5Z7N3_SORBI|nr:uncharacterized protein LOC8083174 [Sorghum bicolor]EER88786.1 hypothetical protein SORBI_3010G221300 [Sorghum bicolor]|eukprot:XP_002437419.1 uncharacterized protein LOC8083174 [Sorghum bicolor]